MRTLVTLEAFLATTCRDVPFAFRQLRKSSSFTATVIVTLTLGIGVNTAVFSVTNALLLRRLPVRHPEQVFYISHENIPGRIEYSGDQRYINGINIYNRLREDRSVVSDLIAYVPLSLNKTSVHIENDAEEARAYEVSGNFFDALGVPMAIGRAFGPEDEEKHSSVAVLSFSYWKARFNRDPNVIGRSIHIRGVPFTIAGVAARRFFGVDSGTSTDLWIPLQNRPELPADGMSQFVVRSMYQDPNSWAILLMVRLKPGVTQQEAATHLSPIYAQASYETAGKPQPNDPPLELQLVPARGVGTWEIELRQPVGILMGMVFLVLLIACVNVVMLVVARNALREREFALRLALGAGRWSLFQLLLVESLLLVTAGALLSWFFAEAAARLLGYWSEFEVSLAPDGSVLGFTLLISALSAIVFGLAPLRTAAGAPIMNALKTYPAGRVTSDRSTTNWSSSLVVAEISFCVVLLTAMGLLVRTLSNFQNTDLGMRTASVLAFGLHPLGAHSVDESVAFYQDLMQRLRAVPGVRSVTMAELRPGNGSSANYPLVIDGRKYPFDWGKVEMRYNHIAASFFGTLGIPLVVGREIRDSDTSGSQRVAVVNQTLAAGYFKDANALGHYVGEDRGHDHLRAEIVGVVRDNKYTSTDEEKVPMVWYSYQQAERPIDMDVEVLSVDNPLDRLPAIRRVVHAIDPNIALSNPQVLSSTFEETYIWSALYARLAVFFGCLAAILVAVGLNGMLAYSVSHRRSEIGIRLALGATRNQVLWLILRDCLYLLVVGIGIGLHLAWFTSRLMSAMLFHLSPHDPPSFVGAVAGVVVVSISAVLIPARRAAAVQPMQTLRVE